MTVTTSRVGTVIEALVAALQASPIFADPIRVYDGPLTGGDTMWTQAVFVGFDGNWHEDGRGTVPVGVQNTAALINQQLAYVGNTTVREEIELQCVAEAWTGDPQIKTVRDLANALFAGVQTVLRTDPTLGIDGSTIATASLATFANVFDAGGNTGCQARFTVHVLTTLPTQ